MASWCAPDLLSESAPDKMRGLSEFPEKIIGAVNGVFTTATASLRNAYFDLLSHVSRPDRGDPPEMSQRGRGLEKDVAGREDERWVLHANSHEQPLPASSAVTERRQLSPKGGLGHGESAHEERTF